MAISSGLGIAGAVPIGVVNPFAGATAPSGWLLCFGQTVSRTQYSGLFLTIGTTYGAGDGSTTFALPDLRGRTIAGEDDMGGTAANRLTSGGSGITGTTLGATGGAETHTLTTAQMPSHTHTQDAHSHTIPIYVASNFTGFIGSNGHGGVFRENVGTNGSIATNQNTGGGGAHNNTQPTIILNYIIKAQ
jgi:microcystin-dependent protein